MLLSSVVTPALRVSPFLRLRYKSLNKSLVQGEVDHSLPCMSPLSSSSVLMASPVTRRRNPPLHPSQTVPCFPIGVAYLRVQTNFECTLLRYCCNLRKGPRISRMHLTNHNRPNSTATPVGLPPWRSSKKVSLHEGETALTPARTTLSTRYGSCKSHTFPRYLRKRGERSLL